MRRSFVLLALPLLLAACDQNTTPPVAETPPPAPAQEAPAATGPSEAQLAPVVGSWAAMPENCATPIVISATSFEGAENLCEITSFTGAPDGAFDAAMTCQGEGQTTSETIRMTPIFGPVGEGIRFEYVDRGGDPVTVFRCGR